ncbi:helix-turn-helix domain-containing protein [Synergistaceae bacterium OttesenSCG-928-I11]|nr:helix-turn-helix domain-containing protein [Synergistaceae bacterium OttesenSCG-928-I11]
MKERLRDVRKKLGMSQTEFAQKLGLTQTSLSMIESGKTKLTEKNVRLLLVTFNVNEKWFRNGQGEMFNSTLYEDEFRDVFLKLEPETQEYLLTMAKELHVTQQKLMKRLRRPKRSNAVLTE